MGIATPPVPHVTTAEAERAAIVRWLRKVALGWDEAMAGQLNAYANRIEEGAHLIEPPVPHVK